MLASGLPNIVGDDEDLARFLTSRGQFSTQKAMAKPALFLPSPKETSVFRHGSEPRDELWTIGAIAAGTRTLYGAAIVQTRDVRSVQLDAIADEPPPRHAVITGWLQDNDPLFEKAKRIEQAEQIASKATLMLRT